jgi:quinol monooxygenase YgiN
MGRMSRLVKFTARPGEGDRLVELLLAAAGGTAEAPGCELWLVHREDADPDVVWVTEVWAGREQCDAALADPRAREGIPAVLRLLREPPQMIATTPAGGVGLAAGD